jgi:thioredoxin 1
MMGQALIVNNKNFEAEVISSQIPVIVDAYAPWCGPCRMMGPIFDELAQELSNSHKCVKLNIDDERDLAIKYNVSSIPTFLFFKNGTLVGKETGYMSKETLKSKIENYLK